LETGIGVEEKKEVMSAILTSARPAERPGQLNPQEAEQNPKLGVSRILAGIGTSMRRHKTSIQRTQWVVVVTYLVLVAVPAFLPLPERTAHIWNNLTVFAQFAFWGIWWPFVLLSMVLVGRAWCGIFCPEGTLTEAVSHYGRGLAVPRWLTWKGWPFIAFVCTTIYGQMTSVYQYPKPVLLILGGSTFGALVIGYLYGKNKRVWCRYMCPVNGVFGLLAKLAPVHFHVDHASWVQSQQAGHKKQQPVNCAPLVAIRTMKGGSDCHMCGRCSDFRGAVSLAPRSPLQEIVNVAGDTPKPWETILITYGLMGVAAGAFHWSASPWYIDIKQWIADYLIDHALLWPMEWQPPWWLLTSYPEHNDTMTLLDGSLMIGYIIGTSLVIGTAALGCVALATKCLGLWSSPRFHHLAQSLIPIAACGVFLGLSGTTISLLRAEGLRFDSYVAMFRTLSIAGSVVWSIVLAWRVSGLSHPHIFQRIAASFWMGCAASIGGASWILYFWIW
jgi:polyferredoxin